MNNIAANIKALRSARGLTQDALAQQLHVTRQAVSNWENGKTQPDIETIMKLAQALNVPAEELIYGKKDAASHPRQVTLLPRDDVGEKLKSVSTAVQIVGTIISVIVGLLSGILAFVIIPLGVFATYAFSMLLHGVGHVAEMSEKCAAALVPQEDADAPVAIEEPTESWTCFSCDTENRGHVAYCQNCGTSKVWSENKRKAAQTE